MTRRLRPVVCIVGLALCAGAALAWTGSLSTGTGGLMYQGGWQPATFSWDVTQVDEFVWRYDYTLSISTSGAISHMVLELTDDAYYASFEYPSQDMFNLQRWDTTSSAWVDWAPSAIVSTNVVGPGNPGLPAPIWGVKFEDNKDTEGDWADWTTLRWRFDAYRNPVWGDFYSKDGNGDLGATKALWNAGLAADDPANAPQDGTINNHILRPNGRTPELPPSALMGLGMLPLGIAYLRGRRRQER